MATVLVTGATGFIAKHIVRELLDKGYAVKASVRSERGRVGRERRDREVSRCPW